MQSFIDDVRFGVRLLWKDRGFTLTTLLTLVVCIGANTAIFAVVNAVLLRPLPFAAPERVVLMYNSYPRAGVVRAASGVPDYYDRLRDVNAFAEIAMYQSQGRTLGAAGSAERIGVEAVTPSFFPLLRVRALRGRTFRPEEGEVGGEHKVILSYALWQHLFAGSDEAIGKDLRLSGEPYSVVGVLPPDFAFLDSQAQAWLPLAFTIKDRSDASRHNNSWDMIGRLRPGATVALAQQQIDTLNSRNLDRFPELKQPLLSVGFHTVAVPLGEEVVRAIRPVLYLLWGGVVCVLVIGCINITNLALVRASGRGKELATRQSLGAGHLRIARQLVVESLLLTLAGGAGGILLGRWILSFLMHLNLAELPRGGEIRMDGPVVLAMLALAAIIGLVVGLVPVAKLLRMDLNVQLREESRGGTSSKGARRGRRALVIAQFAFAFVLLVCAGLLAASFKRVLAVNPGFEPGGVQTVMISLPSAHYKDDASCRAFVAHLLDETRRLPGVAAAGVTDTIPFGDNYSDSVIFPEGTTMTKSESIISPSQLTVSDGYLETMHTHLLRGRLFDASDNDKAPKHILVDTRLAQKFWPNLDPIGRRVYAPKDTQHLTPGPDTEYMTVVGVVDNVKLMGLVESDARFGAAYYPFAQRPTHRFAVAARSSTGDPRQLTGDLRRLVAAIDPELPLYNIKTMDERTEQSLVSRRVPMLLALGFATVALFLAAVGVYGVLAYQVAQRTREIGIRMALGATAQTIARLVMTESGLMLGAGLVLGLAGAFGAGRAMRSLLYAIEPADPPVLLIVTATLCVVAIAAALVPARRAQQIDPAVALSAD